GAVSRRASDNRVFAPDISRAVVPTCSERSASSGIRWRNMAPRTILYTGKGGVGKTSVAAATARRCAAAGLRTVVLSTDPAHSLADSLQTPLRPEPTAVGDRLWAHQVSAQDEMERNWAGVQDWLGD